jgi:uncharacterized protein YciI
LELTIPLYLTSAEGARAGERGRLSVYINICFHSQGGFMHYLLFYDFPYDYLERRAEFRAEHLSLAWQAQARGELILAGALADPVDGAVLLFRGESADVVQRFVEEDPYVKNGLVTRWRVRLWTTVVGADATSPVK